MTNPARSARLRPHPWHGPRTRGVPALLATVLVLAACRAERLPPATDAGYLHAGDRIGTVREIYDGTLTPELAVNTFRNIDRLFAVRRIAPSATPRALVAADRPLGPLRITDRDSVYDLERYLELNRVAAVLVLHDGRVAEERYRFGNSPATRWMSMSVAKSVTSTLIGAAVRDGAIASLDDPVTRYVPALTGSAYEGVTVRHVLLMASGVRWSERYTDSTSDRRRLLEAQVAQRPGALLDVMRALPRAAPPGTVNTYSTGETHVAAEVLRGAVGRPLAEYLSDRIWRPAGMEDEAFWWLDAPDGVEIGGSGIAATARDYARFGQFILEQGIVGTDTILPAGWVREATTPKVLPGGKPLDYGYLWWTASTPDGRRDGAFNAEGIHGQFVYVNPAARVVIVVLSARPHPSQGAVVPDDAFFDAVVRALRAP